MNTTPSPALPPAAVPSSVLPAGADRPTATPGHPQIDATGRVPTAGERAVVLGGGGSLGNAWEIGVIAGLYEAGVDITEADLTIGTSAGATAAAQLTGGLPPTELLAAILDPAPQRPAGPGSAGPGSADRRPAPSRPVSEHMARTAAVIAAAANAADMRSRMGAEALAADAASRGAASARWRDVVAGRLPGLQWPQRPLLITAVDARTGEPVVFDRDSGVDLVDAVAASTSSGFGVPPYAIGDERYLDGGYRRNENADLAAGYARVLVLSPFGGRSRHPQVWGMDLATQVDELRAGGSRVETVFPTGDTEHALRVNAMDVSRRPAAARAGYDQGRALAGRLTEFWR